VLQHLGGAVAVLEHRSMDEPTIGDGQMSSRSTPPAWTWASGTS
jgi:hypothetical protein